MYKMNRIILFLIAIAIGLSAQAFEWSNLLSQPYQTSSPYTPYQPYQPYAPVQPVQTIQGANYSQTYVQPYNQAYCQNPYQYPSQYQGQYVNPYQYQSGYGNNAPYTAVNSVGQNGTGGTGQVVKNIGQSIIYSMMSGRGY